MSIERFDTVGQAIKELRRRIWGTILLSRCEYRWIVNGGCRTYTVQAGKDEVDLACDNYGHFTVVGKRRIK